MNNNHRLVYSTAIGRVKADEQPTPTPTKSDGIVRIRREVSGRHGKGVTTISGIPVDEIELKTIAKTLKQMCGVGGTVKDGVVEIQGDHRERIKAELEKRGYTVKLAGG